MLHMAYDYVNDATLTRSFLGKHVDPFFNAMRAAYIVIQCLFNKSINIILVTV